MQQMQMQMYQMAQMTNPAYAQRAHHVAGGSMLPMLRINNANAVSLDEIGDDFDDEEEHNDPDQTLGLNDESMAEMNMVIGSARLDDDDEFGQFDDSVLGDAVHEHEDGMLPILEEAQPRHGEGGGDAEGWSLRRRGSAEVEEAGMRGEGWMGEEEADDVAEVSSICRQFTLLLLLPILLRRRAQLLRLPLPLPRQQSRQTPYRSVEPSLPKLQPSSLLVAILDPHQQSSSLQLVVANVRHSTSQHSQRFDQLHSRCFHFAPTATGHPRKLPSTTFLTSKRCNSNTSSTSRRNRPRSARQTSNVILITSPTASNSNSRWRTVDIGQRIQ